MLRMSYHPPPFPTPIIDKWHFELLQIQVKLITKLLFFLSSPFENWNTSPSSGFWKLSHTPWFLKDYQLQLQFFDQGHEIGLSM